MILNHNKNEESSSIRKRPLSYTTKDYELVKINYKQKPNIFLKKRISELEQKIIKENQYMKEQIKNKAD